MYEIYERTDEQRDSSLYPSVRPFVRSFFSLSVVSVRGVHPIGRTKPGASSKFKRGGGKNPGSTNKYTKFGQLIISKVIKVITTRCHILRLKCTEIRFLASVS